MLVCGGVCVFFTLVGVWLWMCVRVCECDACLCACVRLFVCVCVVCVCVCMNVSCAREMLLMCCAYVVMYTCDYFGCPAVLWAEKGMERIAIWVLALLPSKLRHIPVRLSPPWYCVAIGSRHATVTWRCENATMR